MLLAYMTASMFMDVFHAAVDTIIMCYITDAEQNNGVPQHADQSLALFLSQHGTLTADHKRIEEVGGNAGPLYKSQINGGANVVQTESRPVTNLDFNTPEIA